MLAGNTVLNSAARFFVAGKGKDRKGKLKNILVYPTLSPSVTRETGFRFPVAEHSWLNEYPLKVTNGNREIGLVF